MTRGVKILAILLGAIVLTTFGTPGVSVASEHKKDSESKTRKKAHVDNRTEARKLYDRYWENDKKASENKDCLTTPKCLNQEGDVLRPLEGAREALLGLEALAAKGDQDASFYRGDIALRLSRLFAAKARNAEAPELWQSNSNLRGRAIRDREVAERFLSHAAGAGHPDACLLLSEIVLEDKSRANLALGKRLLRCATLGYIERKDSKQAVEAFSRMAKIAPPGDLMVAEVYARLGPKEPDSLWRQTVKPEDVVGMEGKPSAKPAAAH